VALLVCVSVAHSAVREDAEGYVRVPGGLMLHRSCIVRVPNGFHAESTDDGLVLVSDSNGAVTPIPRCRFPAKQPAANLQIYAMDTHVTLSSGLVTNMNASFSCPLKPTNDQGQVVYFWPGFKSTEPTMGFPVLQPVLQYGTDSEGGGDYWCVRSWFVCGQWEMALVSDEVPVTPGDIVSSFMSFDSTKQNWVVFANNTATGQTTTLNVARTTIRNTDFKVAMLVLETIMDEGDCTQYPEAQGGTGSVVFSSVTLNGKVPTWEPRVAMHDCGQQVSVAGGGATVKMTWTK